MDDNSQQLILKYAGVMAEASIIRPSDYTVEAKPGHVVFEKAGVPESGYSSTSKGATGTTSMGSITKLVTEYV